MKCNLEIFIMGALILIVILSSCKKDSHPNNTVTTSSDTLLIGLWELKPLMVYNLDSTGHITSTDTIGYIDIYGNPVTLLEEFTKDNKFFVFQDTITPITESSTYTKNGNSLIINLPDTSYALNNSTI